MEEKIHYADLFILRSLFFSQTSKILILGDKNNWQSFTEVQVISNMKNDLDEFYNACANPSTKFIVFNFSKLSLSRFYQNPNLEGIVDFTNKNEQKFKSYYFFNNPDKTIRWIFPKKCKSPAFLYLYNGSGMKAIFFKKMAKILHATNFLKPIVSGQFSIFQKNKETFARHFSKIQYDDFAIFTGTVGENRKAIIALTAQKKCTHFLKIPLTNAAESLVENEFLQLKNISAQKFESLVYPEVQRTATGVAVSNVQPTNFSDHNNFGKVHLQALAELYQNSALTKQIGEWSMWEKIRSSIYFFDTKLPQLAAKNETSSTFENGLSKEKTMQLQGACERIFNQLDPEEMIKVGKGHGDFTPWNMYVSKEKLYVYDWEMAIDDAPLLFDILHYVFQKGILIERKSLELILEEIKDILSLPEANAIIEEYKLDWEKQYQFYLLYIVCYYLPKYILQNELHEQVNWLVDTWLEALQNVEIRVTV